MTRTFGLKQSANEGVPTGAPSFRVRHRMARSAAIANILGEMERPTRFEHARFLGDKRTQLVYDLDDWNEEALIDEIVNEGVGIQFAPDDLAEARNRGYTLATPGKHRLHRKPRA
jgi:hypothetical protein